MTSLTRYLLLFVLLQLTDFALGTIVEYLILPEQMVLEGLSEKYTPDEIATMLQHKDDYFWPVLAFRGTLKLISICGGIESCNSANKPASTTIS